MKHTLSLFVFMLCITLTSKTQYVTCQSMPLAHGTGTLTSFSSDSILLIPITNNSGTDFAYPLGKMIPASALPSGMTLINTGWVVFGSSWNDGQTNDCGFQFNVTSPIPADYMYSFVLRVSNFLPLSIDSCYFTDTITVNLNPSASGIFNVTKNISSLEVFPIPSSAFATIISQAIPISEVCISDISGNNVQKYSVNSSGLNVNTGEMQNGIYICTVKLQNGEVGSRKLLVQH